MADIELLIIGGQGSGVRGQGVRGRVVRGRQASCRTGGSWRVGMSHVVTRWAISLSFLLGLVLFSPLPAAAQGPGIRGGISVDPDQFYFGGHYETSPLID